jgi:hypothetical protein
MPNLGGFIEIWLEFAAAAAAMAGHVCRRRRQPLAACSRVQWRGHLQFGSEFFL